VPAVEAFVRAGLAARHLEPRACGRAAVPQATHAVAIHAQIDGTGLPGIRRARAPRVQHIGRRASPARVEAGERRSTWPIGAGVDLSFGADPRIGAVR
jgi:hypothetical protein